MKIEYESSEIIKLRILCSLDYGQKIKKILTFEWTESKIVDTYTSKIEL
jgi:hypothetical protein